MVDIQRQTLDKVETLESHVKVLQQENESMSARLTVLEGNRSSQGPSFAEATAAYRPQDEE